MFSDKFGINLTITQLPWLIDFTFLKYGCNYDVFVTATVNRLGNSVDDCNETGCVSIGICFHVHWDCAL